MTAVTWSKFYWADWFSDANLRRCTLAAQGLWMNMLCITMQQEPFGYLKQGDEILTVDDIASMTGKKPKQVRMLIAELERRQVLSRDADGCIYSRRLVRDAVEVQRHRKNGAKGGNPNLIKANAPRGDNPGLNPRVNPEDKPQSPESKSPVSSSPESNDNAAPPASPVAPILRAAEAMGTTLDALHRKPSWAVFGDTFATWLEEGCDPDRDIWPTLRTRILKRRGKIPASPAYFTEAVREARDKRLDGASPPSRTIGAPYLASTALVPAAFVTAEQWAERKRMFETHGLWSRRWGPKPGEAGCLVQGSVGQGSGIRMSTERAAAKF